MHKLLSFSSQDITWMMSFGSLKYNEISVLSTQAAPPHMLPISSKEL